MARDRANVNTGIWNDTEHRGLSRDAQWLYYALLTHPTLTYVGVADWRPKRLVPFAADNNVEVILSAAAELSAGLYVVVEDDTEEILVRSFVKHDGVLKQPKLAVSMANAYAQIASNTIRGVVVHELRKQHQAHPEYRCWTDQRVIDILAQPSINPAEVSPFGGGFTPGVGADVSPAVTPNRTLPVGPGLALPTATATATSSSTKKNSPPRSAKGTSPQGFDEWWKHWRKKKSVGDARKAFPGALKKIPLAELIEKTDAWWEWADRTNLEDQYVPYPATWLNREQWADDLSDGGPKPFNIDDWKG